MSIFDKIKREFQRPVKKFAGEVSSGLGKLGVGSDLRKPLTAVISSGVGPATALGPIAFQGGMDFLGVDILREAFRGGGAAQPERVSIPPLMTIFPLTAATGELTRNLAKRRERGRTKFSGGGSAREFRPLSLLSV